MQNPLFIQMSPICPVTDMGRTQTFWKRLGFTISFCDAVTPETSNYAGVSRSGLELHLQTFTPEQMTYTQTMALRIKIRNRAGLETIHAEWSPLDIITAPLKEQPWGTYEFGFFDPDRTPFFFYVDL